MPTWATMTDLSTGDLVTESDMDAIRGNIEYLLDPNKDTDIYDNSAAYTTTSASFVDVDATNVTVTITTNGGPVLVGFFPSLSASGAGNNIGLDIDVDGTREGTAFTFGMGYHTVATANRSVPMLVMHLITGLSAGSHTFKLQWKIVGGATAKIESESAKVGVPMFAVEI